MSEALARLGHDVDIATGEHKRRLRRPAIPMGPRLRRVPLSRVRWSEYDVVKTSYPAGYQALERHGGGRHPFVISRLAVVVGPEDMDGIYFYGRRRRELYGVQGRIAERSRYVSLTTPSAHDFWVACTGRAERTLVVPGAAEREIPPAGPDPYPADGRVRCLYAGNLYAREYRSQREANTALVDKLNALGGLLCARGARLYVIGTGDATRLDPAVVRHLGVVPYEDSWTYMAHAHVGLSLVEGPFRHNNESTKTYHYLRAGLPMVGEAGFPNDDLVRESGIGVVVDNGDLRGIADRVLELGTERPRSEAAVRRIVEHHSWDARAALYDELIRAEGL